MLSENIKYFRKQKGFTQEELAVRLHVVRQTVSKWEKGLSVPDAEQLLRLAEIFEIGTAELLGFTSSDKEPSGGEIAEQLARINGQLAVKNRRMGLILKIILAVIAGIIIVNLILIVLGTVSYGSFEEKTEINNELISDNPDPLY